MIDEDLMEELEVLRMKESLRSRILDLEDVGWLPINSLDQEEDGPDLESLQKIAPKLRDMAGTNPWHIRGAQLRHAYVFGRDVQFNNVDKNSVQTAINNPHNKNVLFSVDAFETANLALFTDGNYFVIRQGERARSHFIVVPLKQVTGVVTNPDDATDIWFIKRSWTANGESQDKWYPVARHKKSRTEKMPRRINDVEVAKDAVIYHRSSKRQTGWTWGIPDSMGALVWTEAYSEYLRDNALLVKALSKVAWKITNTSAKAAANSAVQVRDSGGQVGGTAGMTAGTQLQGVGVPSAQVNMGNGQPLIAAVATSFGVPVIALLSSPGETGGSYGAATSLDEPTLKGMTAVQNAWAAFYQEILQDLGAPDAVMEFPAISTDPTYRQVGSLAQASASGLLYREEARIATLDLLDVPKLYDTLPEPDGFNTWSDPDKNESVSNPVASQGNSGAVGSLTQGDTNHDNDD